MTRVSLKHTAAATELLSVLFLISVAGRADSCSLACDNGGALDSSSCTCSCPSPYTGTTCSEKVCMFASSASSCSSPAVDVETYGYICAGLLGLLVLLHLFGSVCYDLLNKGGSRLPFDPNQGMEVVDAATIEMTGDTVDHSTQIVVKKQKQSGLLPTYRKVRTKTYGSPAHQSLQKILNKSRKVVTNAGLGAGFCVALVNHLQYLAVLSNANDLPSEVSHTLRAFSWANLHIQITSASTATFRRLLESEQSYWQGEREKEMLGLTIVFGGLMVLIFLWNLVVCIGRALAWWLRATDPVSGELYGNDEAFSCNPSPILGYGLFFRLVWILFTGLSFSAFIGLTSRDALYLSLGCASILFLLLPFVLLSVGVIVYGFLVGGMKWIPTGITWTIQSARQYTRELFNPDARREEAAARRVADAGGESTAPVALQEPDEEVAPTPAVQLERNGPKTTLVVPFVRLFQIVTTLDSNGYWEGRAGFVSWWGWVFASLRWYAMPHFVLDILFKLYIGVVLGLLREWLPLVAQVCCLMVVMAPYLLWIMAARPHVERSLNGLQAMYVVYSLVELMAIMMSKGVNNSAYLITVQVVINLGIVIRVIPLLVTTLCCLVFGLLVPIKYIMEGPKAVRRSFRHYICCSETAKNMLRSMMGKDIKETQDEEDKGELDIQVAKSVTTLAQLRQHKKEKRVTIASPVSQRRKKSKALAASDMPRHHTSSKELPPLLIHFVLRCPKREDVFDEARQKRFLVHLKEKADTPEKSLQLHDVELSPVIRYHGCYKGILHVKTPSNVFLNDITTAWSILEYFSKLGRNQVMPQVGTLVDHAFMSDIGQYCVHIKLLIRRKKDVAREILDAGEVDHVGEADVRAILSDAADSTQKNVIIKELSQGVSNELIVLAYIQSVHSWHISNLLNHQHMESEFGLEGFDLISLGFVDAYEDHKLLEKLQATQKEREQYLMEAAFGKANKGKSSKGSRQSSDVVAMADAMENEGDHILKKVQGGTDRDLLRMAEQQGRLKRMGSIVDVSPTGPLEEAAGTGEANVPPAAGRDTNVTQESIYEHEKRMRESQRLMRAAQMLEYEENYQRREAMRLQKELA